jgi:hypothetical protein
MSSIPNDLQVIADAAKAGASVEELEAMAEAAFGRRFELSHVEKRINARVSCLVLTGRPKAEIVKAITAAHFDGQDNSVPHLIVNGKAGSAINQPARDRFDSMSAEERDRKLLTLQALI